MSTRQKFFKIVSCFVFVFAVTCMVNMFALKADEVDLKTQELEEKVKEALGDENGNIDVTKLVTDLQEITKNFILFFLYTPTLSFTITVSRILSRMPSVHPSCKGS